MYIYILYILYIYTLVVQNNSSNPPKKTRKKKNRSQSLSTSLGSTGDHPSWSWALEISKIHPRFPKFLLDIYIYIYIYIVNIDG